MRLATKAFLANLLGIAALAAVAIWSLVAIDRLVSVNRSAAGESAAALRIETGMGASLLTMERYRKAYEAVGWDLAYLDLFDRRGERVRRDLEALGDLLVDPEERRLRDRALVELRQYRAMIGLPGAEAAYAEVRGVVDRLAARTDRLLAGFVDESNRVQAQTRRAVGLALGVGLAIALGAAAFFALTLARDLRRLATAAGEVADGLFAGALPIRRRDEVGALARAFERMAERLGEIDRSKEEFFARVSHEFRTPLTAMREAASLLSEEVAGALDARQRRLVEIVRSSCERLLRLVDQILEISRRRARLRTLSRRPVALDPLVERALDSLRPQAEARRLDVTLAADGPVSVEGDEEELTQVIVNLVGNAIKFSPEGGRVEVRVGRREGGAEIEVRDSGPGIPGDDLAHVFDRFWQARGAEGGSGLGLAIVKSIAEAHGGSVSARSEPGAGARFTVRLPAVGRRR